MRQHEEVPLTELDETPLLEIGSWQERGFSEEETEQIVQYLAGEGLLRRPIEKTVNITHKGIVELETGESSPDQPTEHFPPIVNILTVHQMIGSQIQQGSTGSTQTGSFSSSEWATVTEFIQLLKRRLPELGLEGETLEDAAAQIDTVEAQLKAARPRVEIVRMALADLKGFLLNVAGNLATPTLATAAAELLEKMQHLTV